MTTTLTQYKTQLNNAIVTSSQTQHYTAAKILEAINKAGEFVLGFADWAWLKTAVEFAAEADQEWYDLDESELRIDGVFRVTSGTGTAEKHHELVDFETYQDTKSDQTVYLSALLGRQVFLSPIPVEGTSISLYGKQQWVDLAEDADESVVPTSYDEALVQYAAAYLLRNGLDPDTAETHEQRAKEILTRKMAVQSNDRPTGSRGRVRNVRFN